MRRPFARYVPDLPEYRSVVMHAVYKTDRLKERRGLILRGDENDTSQKEEDARDYLTFSWNEKRERERERERGRENVVPSVVPNDV